MKDLFDGAEFTLKVGGESYSVIAEATVVGNVIYIGFRMSAELQDLLLTLVTPAETNAGKASLETITVCAQSTDSNYSLSADALTRIFRAGKLTF